MYGFLDHVVWSTCVICWRAWYSVPSDFDFQETLRPCSASHQAGSPWFQPSSSVTLWATQKKHVNRWVLEFHTGQDVAAHAFVQQNYEPDVAQKMLSRLIDPDFGRDICICASCSPHVEDHKLQPRQGGRLCDYAVNPVKWWAEDDDEAPTMAGREQRTS